MVSRDGRFHNRRLAFRVQAGEQDRGFDLRTRNRQRIVDTGQLVAPVNKEGRPAIIAIDTRPHQRQRLNDPLHRARSERFIAVAATVAKAALRVRNTDAIDTSFPGFSAVLGSLGVNLSTERADQQ